MDDNQIDSDPQQYREEWFNFDFAIGKEFELPNISSTLINRWLMNHKTNKSQVPTSTASDATSFADTENYQIQTQISASSYPSIAINHKSVLINDLFPSNDEQSLACVFINSANFHLGSLSNHLFLNNSIIETSPLNYPIGPSSASNRSIENRETLDSNDQYFFINPKQEILQDYSVEFNADRKSNACCLHKLTMQSNRSKSNGKKEENNETQAEYFEGDHKCFVCNVAFATGNALGGHMSSHAKKRKIQVMRNGGLSIFKSDETFSEYGLEEEETQQGYENGSLEPPNESVASTDK